jgi:hypothetical protein
MDLQSGAGLHLDRSLIPSDLHEIVPLVERWGFDSMDDQDQFALEMKAHFPSEVEHFNRTLDPHRAAILEWGRSLPFHNQPLITFTEADQQHPFWSFMSALSAREVTNPE